MGNVLEMPATGRDIAEDSRYSAITNTDVFSLSYIENCYRSLPAYDGTDVNIGCIDRDERVNDFILCLQDLFKISSEQIPTSVVGYKLLGKSLDLPEKQLFETRLKMRSRMILRVHCALVREMQLVLSENILTAIERPDLQCICADSTEAILTAMSISMTISLMQVTGGTNVAVFRTCCESLLEVLKRASSVSLSSVLPGSVQDHTLRSITMFAEDIANKSKGADRSLAIALILGVGLASGSLEDVVKAAQHLRKGAEKLPEKAYSFFKVLSDRTVDLELTPPHEKSIVNVFSSKIVFKRLNNFLETSPSMTTDGMYLYIWNGHNCTITKVGTGFHGTVEGELLCFVLIVREYYVCIPHEITKYLLSS
jgi:hypothetical protein